MENNNNEEQQEVKWGGLINEFLWMCAGVNRKVLRQCPTDYAKYAGVGGTILFTALMAMLSSGYALYTVFQHLYVAMGFGIFWGLMIFNLDRYMVNTMYSDGKHTISWEEIKGAFPRLILALFLGVVISTPLELRIFQNEIEVKINETKKSKIREYTAEDQALLDSINNKIEIVTNTPLNSTSSGTLLHTGQKEADELVDQITTTQNSISNKKNELEANRNNYRHATTHSDSIKYQSICVKLSGEIRTLNATLNQLNGRYAAVNADFKNSLKSAEQERQATIDDLKHQRDVIEQRMQDAEGYKDDLDKKYNGFQARMSAFNQMKDEDMGTKVAAWAIMLLFIVLEIIPVMFKIMEEDGPYDDKLRALRYEVKILADKKISDINDEVNTSVEISTAQNQDRLAAEVAANKELLAQIAQAQADILSEAIALWREEELKKVRENPSAYIQSSLEDPLDIQQSGRNV